MHDAERALDDYQQSRFYEKSLEVCPWRNTDHMGERIHNYCTWCEGFVAGAEWLWDGEVTADDLRKS
jgi:hypothetical protein